MIDKNIVEEKIKKGWLDVSMIFEVLAINEEAAKESLEKHIEKILTDERCSVYRKEVAEMQRVENPMKNISEGFSQFCEIGIIVKDMDNIIQMVIEYGPSTVEIIRPNKLEIDIGEAQNILNTVANMMHTFAAAGFGGIVISRS